MSKGGIPLLRIQHNPIALEDKTATRSIGDFFLMFLNQQAMK